MKFKISATEGFARRGELAFDRGAIQTPAFMPVGTNGTVKALEVDNILETGAEIIDIWVFRCQPGVELALDESVYFEDGRQFPRPSQQIVLTGVIKEITTRVRWSLAKASENPQKAS